MSALSLLCGLMNIRPSVLRPENLVGRDIALPGDGPVHGKGPSVPPLEDLVERDTPCLETSSLMNW